MALSLDVRQRCRLPELMDQPDLDKRQHHGALQGLARLNRWSGSAGILWPALRRCAQGRTTPLRILDLSTGGGDVPIRLWRLALRAGLSLEIAGCDISATAIEHARASAKNAGATIDFFQCDVLHDPIPDGYDILTRSLFLHHLDGDSARLFLERAGAATRQLLLINDLRRSFSGLLLAHAAGRLLTTSPIVRVDGPLSVRAAFTRTEALELAQQAGLANAAIVNKWPFRFLLTWQKTPTDN